MWAGQQWLAHFAFNAVGSGLAQSAGEQRHYDMIQIKFVLRHFADAQLGRLTKVCVGSTKGSLKGYGGH